MSWHDTDFRKWAHELTFPDYSFPCPVQLTALIGGNWLDVENFLLINRWKVFHLWQDQLVSGKFIVPVVKRMSRSKSLEILKGFSEKTRTPPDLQIFFSGRLNLLQLSIWKKLLLFCRWEILPHLILLFASFEFKLTVVRDLHMFTRSANTTPCRATATPLDSVSKCFTRID